MSDQWQWWQWLAEQQGWKCWWCGEAMAFSRVSSEPMRATFEHLVPRSKGGPDWLENLVSAHSKCNEHRGNDENWEAHPSMHDTPRWRQIMAFIEEEAPDCAPV